MVDTITPKMGLTKPEIGASANSWGNKLNTNFDLLDQKVIRNTIQWTMTLGDEIPASANGPFVISRFNNAGVVIDNPLVINRQTGDIVVPNNFSVTKNLVITGTFSVTGAMTAPSLTLSGALSALSAAITNAITAAALTLTGAITAASAAISGHVSANTMTANGITSNGNLSAAAQISSNTMVANGITSNGNMNVAGRFDAAQIVHAGQNVWSPHNISPTISLRMVAGPNVFVGAGFATAPAGHVVTGVSVNGSACQIQTHNLQWQRSDGAWISF